MSQHIHRTAEDAATLAALHRLAFARNEQWSEESIVGLLSNSAISAYTWGEDASAMIIVQSVLDEVEILTIASHPNFRRLGHATQLLNALEKQFLSVGATKWLLDVAEDNVPALAFYQRLGFVKDGIRPNYYSKGRETPVNAVLMSKAMGGQGQP